MVVNRLHIARALYFWPSAIVLAVIIYATWLPAPLGSQPLPPIPDIDKLIHAVFGGGLAGAIIFDCKRSRPQSRAIAPAALAYIICVSMALMAVDEAVQGILPIGRPSDAFDLLADWGGIAVAALTAPAATDWLLRHLSR